MRRASSTILNILLCGTLFVFTRTLSAQTCGPVPGTVGCDATACSNTSQPCQPTVMRINADGSIVAVDCACAGPTDCRVEVSGGQITCAGVCDPNDPASPVGACQLFSQDTNNDGTMDEYWCACAPNPNIGICCLDIDDGPIPYDTCVNSLQTECIDQGGVFHPVPGSCADVAACCLPWSGSTAGLCSMMNPNCCATSGGVPLGPDSQCTDANGLSTCPRVCGGIAGIPCNSGEFCKLHVGECCCDFVGVCAPIPTACPDIWDPVCGCDGTTYGNQCEADAAGQSVEHPGPCATNCQPTPDGSACSPNICSDVPEDICIPTALHLDISTGAITVQACDCLNISACHVEFGNATAVGVGYCPAGTSCEAYGVDTDGDGQDDLFRSECSPIGACCADLGGSPLPVPVCNEATQRDCPRPLNFFEGPGTTCDGTAQACCLPLGEICVDIGPICCHGFGGVSLGVGTTCTDPATADSCPQVCGGIAGVPCPSGAFCEFPVGQCGDGDQFGFCKPIPSGCPDVWDPVCGCDGHTYSNECDANAAGVSIRHSGECLTGACCLDTATGVAGCIQATPEECAAQGGTHKGPGTLCVSNGVNICAEPHGACCLNDPTGVAQCVIESPGACADLGGFYQGDDTTCPADPSQPCGVPCPVACPSLTSCFSGCGTLVQGVGCVLFEADSGGTYVLDNHGNFAEGDRVFVTGCKDPNCVTTCQQGNGCLHNNTIEPCDHRPYGLNPGSTYQTGCFPPCLCPLMVERPMRGTLTLTPAGSDMWYDHYAVTNVHFTVPGTSSAGMPDLVITGSGRYRIGGDFALSHQLTLDVQINGGPVQHLDSGLVPGGASFPRIEIQLSENGLFCFDTVLNVDASPVGACCLANTPSNSYCAILTRLTCELQGGSFQGEGTTCPTDPNMPCIEPIGACCANVPGAPPCFEGTPSECVDAGGHFLGDGTTCPADPTQPCPSVCGGIAGVPCNNADEFCKFPPGSCQAADIQGICTPIPQGCPFVLAPVCGCDGVTYNNECEADAAEAQIDHPGPCECEPAPDGLSCNMSGCNSAIPEVQCKPRALRHDPATNQLLVAKCECFDFNECHIELGPNGPFAAGHCPNGGTCRIIGLDSDSNGLDDLLTAGCDQPCGGLAGLPCGAGEFCSYPPGTCNIADRQGVCHPVPNACPDVVDPVCGCDGVTYGNECEASMAGQSIDHPGACGSICCDPADMPTCPEGASCCADGTWACNDGAGQSTCTAPGTVCPEMCGGIAGLTCHMPDTFCKFPPGTCDIADNLGLCAQIPDGCFDVWDPVCGCDGVTYGNECEADRAQVSIDHPGPCATVCGGFAGLTCGSDEFCKFPEGICSDAADQTGVCIAIPDGCPNVYDPVCGCDNHTYVNECFADIATVSVLHRGPCPGSDCAATRVLLHPQLSYCPDVPKHVVIALTPPAGTSALAIEDAPPPGWTVGPISNGGTYDAVNGKVKWGPFFPPFPAQVTYEAIPSSNAAGSQCFSGTVSIEGINEAICGDDCIDLFCQPHIPADMPQPGCPNCPLGDCGACPHGACHNGQVSLCEVIGYACAWKVGCNDDLAGVARAAYIWRNGECYCWDEALQNWYPQSCPAPGSGYCPTAGANSSGTQAASAQITANAQIRQTRLRRTGFAEEIKVAIPVAAPTDTSVYALEVTLPSGWVFTKASNGGEWDDVHRKIKWGPYYDEQSRTVMFVAVRELSKQVRGASRDGEKAVDLSGFSGTISFDGSNQPIVIR